MSTPCNKEVVEKYTNGKKPSRARAFIPCLKAQDFCRKFPLNYEEPPADADGSYYSEKRPLAARLRNDKMKLRSVEVFRAHRTPSFLSFVISH
jgi:hypothetical protein